MNNAPGKEEWRTSREKHMGKKFNIMGGGLDKPLPTKSNHGMEPNM